MAANVLLLRAPGSSSDKYETSFKSRGYHPIFIPVLETVLVNVPDFREVVLAGPTKWSLDGVIVTSARACEAWKAIVEQLTKDGGDGAADIDWSVIPFYVVGESTAAALSDIQHIPFGHRFAPQDIRGGTEAGTSEKLAHFILQDLNESGEIKKALLYLTGDKNRDTLPSILKKGGVQLKNLQVYETRGSSRFADDLQEALGAVPPETDIWWIVYFAPSAADFVTPTLRKHFTLPGLTDAALSDKHHAHLAAIGPTTAVFLHDTLHLLVNVTAPKPTPDALAGAIKQFDTS